MHIQISVYLEVADTEQLLFETASDIGELELTDELVSELLKDTGMEIPDNAKIHVKRIA